MRAILLFLSSILTFAWFSAKAETTDADSNVQRRQQSFQIETKKAAVTGILITKEDAETITGSMVNEFGVSAIDFVYTKKSDKLKLVNVVSFLNKWYIKPVLKKDLNFCVHMLFDMPYTKKHHYEVSTDGDTITINNSKRHLKYTFAQINPTQNDTEE